MKFITSLAICLFITSTSLASKEIETYPKEACQEIYKAIGTFISLADVEWKQDNAEKAMFYSTASANYATIYETVCRE
jgi:glycerol dehydrogenase-like iron-containing ADH family enzyme